MVAHRLLLVQDWDGSTYHKGNNFEPKRAGIHDQQRAIAKANRIFGAGDVVDASSAGYGEEDGFDTPNKLSYKAFLAQAHDMSITAQQTKRQQKQEAAFNKVADLHP